MNKIRFLRPALGAAAALLLIAAAPAVLAQDQGPGPDQGYGDALDKRLDRIEKQLREVRDIVLQAHATGAPVEIKEAGPDPQVVALTSRLDDMDQTLRGITGQIEQLQHDAQMAQKSADAAQTANAALNDRVAKLEAAVAALTPPAAAAPQASGAPVGDGGLAGQAAAGPGGAPPPPTGPADPKEAYAAARQLLLSGDYKSAEAAFQDYVNRFGDTPNAHVARYWLGETEYIQEDYADAAQAYLGAIRGWPDTEWAPDAVVKLALSLVQINRAKDACGALAEFDHRYPHASEVVKGRAAEARQKAACSP